MSRSLKSGVLRLLLAASALAAGTGPVAAQAARPRVTLDPSTTYQTMAGWEATLDVAELHPSYSQFADSAIRKVVDDVGIDRIRLPIRAGVENTRASWKIWRNSANPDPPSSDYDTWRATRYATVDDNGDPDVINWNGFHFDEIDDDVENRLLPIRSRIEGRGEKLHVNLSYTAFTGQILGAGNSYHHDDPAEYAEFILATCIHLRDTWDVVPDTVQIMLEPDNTTEWTGNLLGRALVETERRLSAEGFHPGFTAPSTTSMLKASQFFDAMAQVNGATDLLTELTYHRYQNVSPSNLQQITSRAATYGLKTGMLEHYGGDHNELHEDLTLGNNSCWQRLGILSENNDGGTYLWMDDSGASPVVRLNQNTRYLRLYFLWVRQGAVRVGAASTDSALAPIGFVNADDRPTVVVKTTASRDFDVAGLPAGTYGIRYATSSQESVDRTDVRIADGEVVAASIPAAGVITVYAKSLDSGPPPVGAPQIVASSPQGTNVTVVANSLRTFSVTAQDPQALPLTYSWTVDGAAAGSTGPAFDHVPAVVGTDVVAVTVSNGTEQTQRTWNVNVVASITVHDPAAPPPVIALPTPPDADARRQLEFSADPSFAKPRVRMKVKKGLLAAVPGKRAWLDVLRLGAGGGTIHARLVYPDDDLVEVLEDSIVSDPVDPTVVSPADAAALLRGRGPDVEFTAAATRRAWLEFSPVSDFSVAAGTAPLGQSPSRVSREAWKRVLSKLKRKGAPDGGFYRVACEDLIGRTTRSAVRSFQLP